MEQGHAPQSWREIPHSAEATVTDWLQHTALGFHDDSDFLDASRGETSTFTQQLLQLIANSDDAVLTALGLRKLAQEIPAELPRKDKIALRAGSLTALGVPWAVQPMAKRWLRERATHLLCAANLPSDSPRGADPHLSKALQELRTQNSPAVVELHGEKVLGPEASHRELRRLLGLAYMPEVEYLLADVGRLAPGDAWASEARAQRAVAALRQLITEGAEHGTFVTITAATYSDSLLAATVTNKLLADPDVLPHQFGVTLYAEVPESFEILTALAIHASGRKAVGGGDLQVRIALRSTASREAIDSLLSGQQFAVLESRAEIEAAAMKLLLQAQRIAGVTTVFCSDSPYLVAAALAQTEPATTVIEVRSGICPELVLALTATGVATRVTLPVVSKDDFRAIMPHLLALTAEAADDKSVVARSRMLEPEYLPAAELRYAELQHLYEVCERAAEPAQLPRRTQDRAREWDPSERDSALFYRPADDPFMRETGGLTAAVLGLNSDPDTGEIILEQQVLPRTVPVVSESGFAAEPGTDVTRFPNRQWFRAQIAADPEADLEANSAGSADATAQAGADATGQARPAAEAETGTAATTEVSTAATATETATMHTAVLQNTLTARARVLRRIALTTVAERDLFTRLFAAHTELSAKQIDAQVNTLIDTARYLAQQAEGLERVRGARFRPAGRVLLAGDEAAFLVDLLAAFLAEYAAGNPVYFGLEAAHTEFVTRVLRQWQAAGLPQQAFEIVAFEDFIADAAAYDIVRGVTVGSLSLRRAVMRAKPALAVNSRSYQLGVATVTPSADYPAAAAAIVESAFGGDDAGLRQVRAVCAVGSAYRAERFRQLLIDAVRSIPAGATHTTDPLQHALPPLSHPPTAAEYEALTALERGETWLLPPRQLDDAGLVWSPGIKAGISPHSSFWEVAARLPVLGLMHCRSLTEALSTANELGSGAVAALFSWDAEEIIPWLDRAKAATLTVNRTTSGARVERLPGGTWSGANSSIAPLTGGPHQLLTLGAWQLREGTPSTTLHLRGLEPEIAMLIETTQEWLDYAEFDRLRRAALADALTWRTQLGVARDVSNLGVEHNILRYWPVASHIRVAEDTPIEQIVRVLSAALLVRAPISVSTGMVLPEPVQQLLQRQGVEVVLETDATWVERIAVTGPQVAGVPAARIRLIGADAASIGEWVVDRASVAIWAEPVTMAGPLELLTFLREQAVAIAAWRDSMVAQQPLLLDWLREIGR